LVRGTGVQCTEPAAHHTAVETRQESERDEMCGRLNADELVEGFRRHRMNQRQIDRPLTHRQVRRLIVLKVT